MVRGAVLWRLRQTAQVLRVVRGDRLDVQIVRPVRLFASDTQARVSAVGGRGSVRVAVCLLISYLVLLAAATVSRAAVPTWPWMALARCEQGSADGIRWHAYSRTYEGGYGFVHGAWRQYRLPGYPLRADRATPEQQTAVARRIQRAVGWRAWPSCSIRLGLR
jgi:hypothetical protein